MEKGTLSYPISTGYRANWGDWESVREIYQNAVDTGEKVKVTTGANSITIRDYGEGFGLRNLIIGESSKDGVTSVGKFGEGLKFALLALVRSGKTVEISTGDLRIIPRLEDTFGANTLAIDYGPLPGTSIQGTKVKITGLTETFPERFLPPNRVLNFQDRVLADKPGQLFIKGIYVKNIESGYGYNLNMERENPMTGDVDQYNVNRRIAEIMRNTNDRDYVRYIVGIVDRGESSKVELQWSTYINGDMKHPVIWREEVESRFGKNVCRETGSRESSLAQYYGYRTVRGEYPILHSILQEDQVVIQKHTRKETRLSRDSVSPEARANLDQARDLITRAHPEHNKPEVWIVRFEDSDTLGVCSGGRIKISANVLESGFRKTLATLIHEYAHLISGANDLTPEFEHALTDVSTRIIELQIAEMIV